MKASGLAPDSGDQSIMDLSDDQVNEVFKFATLEFTSAQLQRNIDNLDVSADVKLLLFKVSTRVIRVGETVVKIGQKVLETALRFLRAFPNTTFGVIFGAIAGALLGSVPLVGWVLGPLVTPILLALGVVHGAKQDLLDKALESRIKASVMEYSVLDGEPQHG